MAIRVRVDGTMWCAALTDEEPGDTYIDDTLHYEMSAIHGVLVSYPMPRHLDHPQWWWRNSSPEGVDKREWDEVKEEHPQK